ncbi:MAG: ribosome small subunit-dependent GTPase A [Firmicutes bacterium]|nr:ribosome small subunit-dependent GTPase A [Bacillota bacterium]
MGSANTGRVIRCHSNFFDVLLDGEVVRCVLRGRLRLERSEVLAGDWVETVGARDGSHVIQRVLERKNELARPPVANVDMLLVVFTLRQPPLNLAIVDRLLVLAEECGLEAALCMNKADIYSPDEVSPVLNSYAATPYRLIVASARTGQGVAEVRDALKDKVSVLAGQSGVGKSSILNALIPGMGRETGEVSRKTGRGRHTTKGVELLVLPAGGFVADTPGFARLELEAVDKSALVGRFPEFEAFQGMCRFSNCVHRQEPGCAVKEAVVAGRISASRYGNYVLMLDEAEMKEDRRYR